MREFRIIRGDDYSSTITFTDQSGEPINITGYTVFFTVKRKGTLKGSDTDTQAIIAKTITVHSDPTEGQTTLTLTNTETTILPTGSFVADIQIKDDSGLIASSQVFSFRVLPDVTRRTDA